MSVADGVEASRRGDLTIGEGAYCVSTRFLGLLAASRKGSSHCGPPVAEAQPPLAWAAIRLMPLSPGKSLGQMIVCISTLVELDPDCSSPRTRPRRFPDLLVGAPQHPTKPLHGAHIDDAASPVNG